METQLLLGDCLDQLKNIQDNSVDSIVTDPPYGLSFMGKKWDYDVPSTEIWEECMRVLKPGGHLLSFAGSRTYHRMAVRIEDAGFEIRDQIMWIYGSGFPKSHNIGKAVDKIEGNEREVVLKKEDTAGYRKNLEGTTPSNSLGIFQYNDLTKGNSPYEGWGTALKPAHEPIVMARKPFSGTVADNVLEWGTGGINIDGCRIGYEDTPNPATNPKYRQENGYKTCEGGQLSEGAVSWTSGKNGINTEGRFPANIIFECTCDTTHTKPAPKSGHWPNVKTKGFGEFGGGESSYEGIGPKEEGDMVIHTDPNCPCYILDEQSGTKKSIKRGTNHNKEYDTTKSITGFTPPTTAYSDNNTYGDTGGASRFFYCPKANKKDRDEGVEYVGQELKGRDEGQDAVSNPFKLRPAIGATYAGNQTTSKIGANPDKPTQPRANIHPTVKPTDLMQYLIRLVTPKGGIVLDPFTGSGSTGKAAVREGMNFIGIEREEEYFEIAKQRIEHEVKKKPNNKFWD